MIYLKIKQTIYKIWDMIIPDIFKSEHDIGKLGTIIMEERILIEGLLIIIGYQPNYFSIKKWGELTSMRKMYIDEYGDWRQIHIRIYKNGNVYAHDELSYEQEPFRTQKRLDIQPLDEEERSLILEILG